MVIKRLFVALLLLLTLVLPGLNAHTLEFDMPGLAGGASSATQIDSFVYSGMPAGVNDVHVRFAGVIHDLGLVFCPSPPGYPDTLTWYFVVDAELRKKSGGAVWRPGDYWLSFQGPFDDTKKFYNGFPRLVDGDVVDTALDFKWNEDWIYAPDPCYLIREGSADMYSVTVILDVTYGVPVKLSTWGRIKELYK